MLNELAATLESLAEDKNRCYVETGFSQYLHEGSAYLHAAKIARELFETEKSQRERQIIEAFEEDLAVAVAQRQGL